MSGCSDSAASGLSVKERAAIEAAVKETASNHLNSRDATTALGYYEPDATVASNGCLYPSFAAFAAEIEEFYAELREIHRADWDDVRVDVLSTDSAVFTARFRWSSTDAKGLRTDLEGVWTAVFVRGDERWRIRARHESFAPSLD